MAEAPEAPTGDYTRQGTYGQEPPILKVIDERFEELEETKALAALVPELYHRLFAVEEKMQVMMQSIQSNLQLDPKVLDQLQKPTQGPCWGDTAPPAPKLPPEALEEREETRVMCASVDSPEESPVSAMVSVVSYTANRSSNQSEGDGLKVETKKSAGEKVLMKKSTQEPVPVKAGMTTKEMVAVSPAKRRNSIRMTDYSRAKISDMSEQVLAMHTTEYYKWGESTWDLVVFVGTGALGPLGSAQTVLLAVVNVMMQLVFVGIAVYNFTTPEIDEDTITEAVRWRRWSGHAMSEYSTVGRESLAQRVCSLDKSLEQSGIQVLLYENIGKYLKPEAVGYEVLFTGPVLCLVALICWYLMVAKEVSHALALHRGIMATPTGPTRMDTRENPFTCAIHYRLRAVPKRRKTYSCILLLYRLIIAAILLFVGTYFLVYTVSVTELILNAVALGIILDIDDLLFDAMATTSGRHMLHQLDPMQMPSLPRIRGMDAKAVFMTLFIPTLTLVVYSTMLGPMVETLRTVEQSMCGGNLDFVWNLDKRGVVLLSPTEGGGWQAEQDSIKTSAVTEAVTNTLSEVQANPRFGVWLSDVGALSDFNIMNLEELLDANNPTCGDMGNSEPMLNYLKDFFGNQSIRGCQDVKSYCGSLTKMPEYGLDGGKGWAARMLCSETCGCQVPGGESISVQGCPYGFGTGDTPRPCQDTSAFKAFRESSSCIEKNASALQQSVSWQKWIAAIRSYGESTANLHGKQDALSIAQAMWDHGCGFAANLSAQNIMWGDCYSWNSSFEWDFKTVENFCPQSCACGASRRDSGCPRPFSRDCDDLGKCLVYNGEHLCAPSTAITHGQITTVFTATDPTFVESQWLMINGALLYALTYFAEVDMSTMIFWIYPAGSLIIGHFTIFQVDATMDLAAIDAKLYNATIAGLQAVTDAVLAAQGANVSRLGLSIASLSNLAAGPTAEQVRRLEHATF